MGSDRTTPVSIRLEIGPCRGAAVERGPSTSWKQPLASPVKQVEDRPNGYLEVGLNYIKSLSERQDIYLAKADSLSNPWHTMQTKALITSLVSCSHHTICCFRSHVNDVCPGQ